MTTSSTLHRTSRKPRQRGAVAVEFALLLMPTIMLFAFVSEWLRFSMMSQTLARATHQAARAVAGQPTAAGCEATVVTAFQSNRTAAWLLDRNNDGELEVAASTVAGWPALNAEVAVAISWEDDPNDGTEARIAWDDAVAGSCGDTGSWLRIRARTAPLPWFGGFRPLMPNGLPLSHESWARNNRT